jgi:hypothetical protein
MSGASDRNSYAICGVLQDQSLKQHSSPTNTLKDPLPAHCVMGWPSGADNKVQSFSGAVFSPSKPLMDSFSRAYAPEQSDASEIFFAACMNAPPPLPE